MNKPTAPPANSTQHGGQAHTQCHPAAGPAQLHGESGEVATALLVKGRKDFSNSTLYSITLLKKK